MALLEAAPAVLKVLLVFGVVLAAIRGRLSLGNAFVLGAVCLGLLFGMRPKGIAAAMLSALSHPKTLSLAAVVSLILVLSHSMEAAGQMARLLENFRGLVRHGGLNLVVFPALIGLLPMPGGAIFSAPMVKNLGERRHLSPERLSYANYWYRHIWEYWWPLYPGVLLTPTLAGIDLLRYVGFLFPLSVAAAVIGYRMLRVPASAPAPAGGGGRLREFLVELQPILVVIVLGLGLGAALTPLLAPRGVNVGKELGLIAALLAAIGWVWRRHGFSAARRREILLRRELLAMVYMVAGILIFKEVLEASRAVQAVSDELVGWRIPLFTIAVLLPMLVGLVCGIAIAYVGISFPILVSLVSSLGQGDAMLAYMMLATVSGFTGVLLSPLHLCLLLSNQYFQATFAAVYRYLLPSCAALLLAGCGYFLLLRAAL